MQIQNRMNISEMVEQHKNQSSTSTNFANSPERDARIAAANAANMAIDRTASNSISNHFSSPVTQISQSLMNMNNEVGKIQIADGTMDSFEDVANRVRELIAQSSVGTYTDVDRKHIQSEINQLGEHSNNLVNETTFNGNKLLDGSSSSLVDVKDIMTAFEGLDVSSKESSIKSMDTIDSILENISDIRTSFDDSLLRIETDSVNANESLKNTAPAESKIKDLDFENESANLSKSNMRLMQGSMSLSHANVSSANTMRLLM